MRGVATSRQVRAPATRACIFCGEILEIISGVIATSHKYGYGLVGIAHPECRDKNKK